MHKGLVKTHLFVVILLLVLLHTFSFGVAMGMETDKQGQMSDCPFTMTSSLCKMNFSEHLSLWKSIFTTTVENYTGILAILGFIVLTLGLKYLATDQDKKFTAYNFYDYEHQSFVPNKLVELFSKGILNPKIYSFATL